MCKLCLRFTSGITWLPTGGPSACYLGARLVEGIHHGLGLFDVVPDLHQSPHYLTTIRLKQINVYKKYIPWQSSINITSNLFLIFKILLNKVDSTDWRRHPYPIYCRLLPSSAVSVHALWSTGFRFSWHCKFLTRTWDILSHEVRNVDSSQRHIPLIVLLSFIAYLLNIGSTTRIETLTSYHQLFHNSMLIYF